MKKTLASIFYIGINKIYARDFAAFWKSKIFFKKDRVLNITGLSEYKFLCDNHRPIDLFKSIYNNKYYSGSF